MKTTKDIVAETVLKMREVEACSPSETVREMVKAGGDAY